MKKYVIAILGGVFLAASVHADIAWNTADQYLKDADGVLLDGSTDQTTGFIQLLSLGTDATVDTLVGADDYTVLATSWVGEGNAFFNPTYPGVFNATDTVAGYTVTAGEDFAIRVFDTASSDYASGIAPTTGNYGYMLFIDPTETAGNYTLSVNSDLLTTQAIPEPATLLIFGPGIAGLLGYRRRKDKMGNLRDLFERRRESIKARKAIAGTERESADYVTKLSNFLIKRDHQKRDLLGDVLMAIDARISK